MKGKYVRKALSIASSIPSDFFPFKCVNSNFGKKKTHPYSHCLITVFTPLPAKHQLKQVKLYKAIYHKKNVKSHPRPTNLRYVYIYIHMCKKCIWIYLRKYKHKYIYICIIYTFYSLFIYLLFVPSFPPQKKHRNTSKPPSVILALAFKAFGTSFRGTSAMTKALVPQRDQREEVETGKPLDNSGSQLVSYIYILVTWWFQLGTPIFGTIFFQTDSNMNKAWCIPNTSRLKSWESKGTPLWHPPQGIGRNKAN